MGHSTIAITADLYGHILEGQDRLAANALDDVMNRAFAAADNQAGGESSASCLHGGTLARGYGRVLSASRSTSSDTFSLLSIIPLFFFREYVKAQVSVFLGTSS
jgi:hypothetical protein